MSEWGEESEIAVGAWHLMYDKELDFEVGPSCSEVSLSYLQVSLFPILAHFSQQDACES